jgi:hypothetical protein
MPRVSVVIPNYNYARYLPQRIESILRQTEQDLEIIIIDDASTDDSREVIARYRADARVRTLFFEENSGSPYRRWNDGAALATGNWLLFAGADDWCEETMLARLLALAESTPGVGIAYCQSTGIDSEDRAVRSWKEWTDDIDPVRWSADFVEEGVAFLPALMLKNIIPNASAALIRRDAFERAGGFSQDLRLCSDWQLYARILGHAQLAFIAEPLNYFRTHGDTVRAASARTGEHLREAAVVIGALAQRNDIPNADRSHAIRVFVRRWLGYRARCGKLVKLRDTFGISSSFGSLAPYVRRTLLRGIPRAMRISVRLLRCSFIESAPL